MATAGGNNAEEHRVLICRHGNCCLYGTISSTAVQVWLAAAKVTDQVTLHLAKVIPAVLSVHGRQSGC